MKTVIQIIHDLPGAPFASRALYERAVMRHVVRRVGEMPLRATYDAAGNCLTCGEAGRCPGWHLPEEISVADFRLSA